MELIQRTISVTNSQAIYVAPLGDIQYTGRREDVALDHLDQHLAYCQSLGAYYLGTGDYGDGISPSNRARLRASGLYDNTERTIQDALRERIDRLYTEHLKATTGKWLGLVHGHHWGEIGDGETTDTYLAKLLGTTYLGTCAFVILDFVSADDSQRHGQITFWVHHGTGSGKAGAALNRMENFANALETDAIFTGHTTKVSAAPISRMYAYVRDGVREIRHKNIYLVNAGGWSKAYALGSKRDGRVSGDYAELAMLSPAALGGSILKIVPRWDARRWNPILKVEV